MTYKGVQGSDYVPMNLFFGKYGDYVELTFCADCGQIQSKFPISETALKEAMDTLTRQ
jgi:hypothetical protein